MAATQTMAGFDRGSLVLQGVLAILFGIAAVFWPGLTLVTLVYLFAAFVLIDGLVVLIVALLDLRDFTHSILALLLGLLEVGVGLYLLTHPKVSFATLIIVLGFSLIVRGLFSAVRAFTRTIDPAIVRTMHGIIGALGVAVGIVVLYQPEASGVAFVWLLGLYALIVGPVLIALSSDLAHAEKR